MDENRLRAPQDDRRDDSQNGADSLIEPETIAVGKFGLRLICDERVQPLCIGLMLCHWRRWVGRAQGCQSGAENFAHFIEMRLR